MIGRAPMMPPPGFGSPFPVLQSAAPNFASPLLSQPAAGNGIPAQPARPQLAQQQAPPPRIIRGQRPDEQISADQGADAPHSPRRQPALHMPSPEELGVPGSNVRLDWTSVHGQLDRLGATCFHQER